MVAVNAILRVYYLPRSVFWSADFNGRSDNTDVIPLMTWFDKLTGFPESSAEFVRANLSLSGDTLQSLANGRSIAAGTFSTPSLAELRQNSELRNRAQSKLLSLIHI